MLRAGDRLPSERNLIEILDISRPSLREALRALSILGVVDTRHGGGAYVTNLEARTLLAPLDFFLALSEANLADSFDSRCENAPNNGSDALSMMVQRAAACICESLQRHSVVQVKEFPRVRPSTHEPEPQFRNQVSFQHDHWQAT